jgi:hypothetical protein
MYDLGMDNADSRAKSKGVIAIPSVCDVLKGQYLKGFKDAIDSNRFNYMKA